MREATQSGLLEFDRDMHLVLSPTKPKLSVQLNQQDTDIADLMVEIVNNMGNILSLLTETNKLLRQVSICLPKNKIVE